MHPSPDRLKIVADHIATFLLLTAVGVIGAQWVSNPVVWAWAFLGIGSLVKLVVLNGGNHQKQAA